MLGALPRRFQPPLAIQVAGMVAASTLLAAGCSEDATDRGLVSVRDTAGIRLVENAAGVLDVAPRLTLADAGLDIGSSGAAPAFEFAGVLAAHRMPGDTIVVVDRTSGELRFFSPEGEHVRSVGRWGQGPGEFGHIASACLLSPDTIAVWDRLNQRITLIDGSGGIAAEIPVDPDGTGRGFDLLTRLPDGEWAVRTRHIWYLEKPGEPVAEDVVHDSVSYLRLAPDGATARPVATLPHHTLDVRPRDARGTRMRIPVPMAFSPTAHVVGSAGLVITGRSAGLELTVRGGDGVQHVVRLELPGRPVAPEHVEALLERRRAELAGRPAADVERELAAIRETPSMDRFPAFDRVVAGRDSTIWVRRFVAPGDGTASWLVFDPRGALAGTLELPASTELLEADADEVILRRRDELDVETVARRAVERGGIGG